MNKSILCLIIWFFLISSVAVGQRSGRSERISITGKLEVIIMDTESEPIEMYRLHSARRTFQLFSNQKLSVHANQTVHVTGFVKGNELLAGEVKALSVRPTKTPVLPAGVNEFDTEKSPEVVSQLLSLPAPTTGVRELYIAPVNFSDEVVTNMTIQTMSNRILGTENTSPSVKGFFHWASSDYSGQAKFEIDGQTRTNWITLPFTKEHCNTGSNMTNECTNWVKNYLTSQGVILEGKSLLLAFPAISSVPGAAATLGVKGSSDYTGTIWLPLNDLTINNFEKHVAHEIGHNLGLGHSKVLGPDGSEWLNDPHDFMNSANLAGPNIYHRLVLGWFTGRIITVTAPVEHRYIRVHNHRSYTKYPKVVIIQPRDANGNPDSEWRFVSDPRQRLPYDDFRLFPTYDTGMIVIKGSPDMTQGGYSAYPKVLDCGINTTFPEDAPCLPGQSWSEPNFGLTMDYLGSSLPGGLMFGLHLD